MAICDCGCGRHIGAFATSQKSANKMGAQVRETRAGIEEHLHPAPGVSLDTPEAQRFLEGVKEKKEAAAFFDEECLAVVHQEHAFGQVDWPLMRAWLRDTRSMVSLFALPREQQRLSRSS